MTDTASFGLRWVVDEVTATLEAATTALAAYLQTPADRHQLQFCQAHLHQVAGSLTLAESRGGALLTEAMEAVVAALLNGEIANPEQAGEALAAAAATLPGYLQRSLASRRERPGYLIALLNDLRALLHQPLASESGLFAPDLTPFEARSQALPPTRNNAELAALCRKLRQVYQHALLALLKGEQGERQIELLAKVGQRMGELFPDSRRQLLWDVYGTMLANLGAVPRLGTSQRQLLWQLDRDLRACSDLGATDAEQPPVARELFKNFLYYAAAGEHTAALVLRETFGLDAEVFGAGVEQGDPWSLPSAALRTALGNELLGELGALRHLGESRSAEQAAFADIVPRLAGPLRRLRDTLVAAGLGKSVATADRIVQLLDKARAAPAADATDWTEWARGVEQLDRLIQSWVTTGMESDDPAAAWAALAEEATAAALVPIRGLLDDIKEAVIGHASARGEPARLEVAVAHAEQIRRSLLVVGLESLSDVLADCGTFLAQLQGAETPLSWPGLDSLADCLIAAELYLELLSQRDIEAAASALTQAQQRAARLRGESLPTVLGAPDKPEVEAVASAATIAVTNPAETLPEALAPIPEVGHGAALVATGDTRPVGADTAASLQPAASPSPTEDDLDFEIRDIFIEEAREVLASITQLDLGTASTPPPNLTDLRRGFHTLKGSGRMVGATAIGELGWAIENLLNRVLEASIPWSGEIAGAVAQSLTRLPALVEEFAAGDSGTTEHAIDTVLREHAALLASGTKPAVAAGATADTPADEATAEVPGGPEHGLPADFRDEALAQITVLERFVTARGNAGIGPRPEIAARAIHTLIGCCERVGHPALSRALRSLEALVTIHAERGLAPGAEMLTAIDTLSSIGRRLMVTGDGAAAAIAAPQAQLDRLHAALASPGQSRERLRATMAGSLNELLAAAEWLDRSTDATLPAERLRGLLDELGVLVDSVDSTALPTLGELAGPWLARRKETNAAGAEDGSFAFGSGIADDKLLHAYVEQMIVGIDAGSHHSLALRADGRSWLFCWPRDPEREGAAGAAVAGVLAFAAFSLFPKSKPSSQPAAPAAAPATKR